MSGGLGLGGAATYKIVTRDETARLSRFEKQPTVKKDVERFQAQAPKIKSVDDLLKDRRTLQFVLTAFQLEDSIDQRAILRKIMTENPKDSKSLVNRLADPRYSQLAALVSDWSKDPMSQKAVQDKIVQGYKQNAFEKDQGSQTPGMREALYFRRTIGSATTLSQVMSDKALLQVVRVGLGLPDKLGMLSYDQQKTILDKRVDVKAFSDPKYVDRFVQRFLVNNDLQQNQTSDPRLALFGGSGGRLSVLV